MSHKQIFHEPEEMCEQIMIALHHENLYIDIVKDIRERAKLTTQYTNSNTIVLFTDDDLLLGFKPHNHSIFVIGYT